MNLIDSTIELFAPRAAKRRLAARMQMDALRAYDGASQGRRVRGWNAPATDADAEIVLGGPRLRARSRDLVRNNAHAARGVAVLADNIVGEGIIPRANTGSPEKDKKINELWEKWVKVSDVSGQINFYGQQYLACRETIEGGDILARRRLATKQQIPAGTKPEDVPLSLRIQLLEADFLDDTKQSEGNKIIVSGVEFNKQSQRVGYWLYEQHPGSASNTGGSTQSKKVPAEDIAHLYEPQRTQARGVPWFSPVIIALRDLDEYEQAELVRKKIEACVVAIVTNPDDDTVNPGINTQAGVVDAAGKPIERFEPGLIAYSRGGKDIKFNNPSVTAGHETYVRSKLRGISAGMRIPYELLTNDLSEVNFSSSRVGILEFRRFIRSFQWNYFIPMFCQPVWDWFIFQAKLEGHIQENEVIGVKWSPPRFDQISPIDDVRADIMTVRAGFRSAPAIIASYGDDPDTVLREQDEWNVKVDATASSIVTDADPRNTTLQGIFQIEEEAGGETKEGKQNGAKASSAAKPGTKK